METESASSFSGLTFSKSRQLGRCEVIEAAEFRDKSTTWQDLERQCESYLEYFFHDIRVIRLPNAVFSAIYGNNSLSANRKGLISKFLKGIPDFVILREREGKRDFLCIELKRGSGKMRQGQKKWSEKVTVHVCKSFEDFQEVFECWYK